MRLGFKLTFNLNTWNSLQLASLHLVILVRPVDVIDIFEMQGFFLKWGNNSKDYIKTFLDNDLRSPQCYLICAIYKTKETIET